MDRTPPVAIRRLLRSEVGFACPVEHCGNPYLEWHHFDPPWRESRHHNAEGMIALCREHHAKADAGALTIDQLRALKCTGNTRSLVRGRFEWMRRELMAVVGTYCSLQAPIVLKYREQPVIWFKRDLEGYLSLNLTMLTTSNEQRLVMRDNYWLLTGSPIDFECPPSGRLIDARYSNGDRLRVEFLELCSVGDFSQRYGEPPPDEWLSALPITAVELRLNVANTDISFAPNGVNIGPVSIGRMYVAGVGVSIGNDGVGLSIG